MDRKKPRISQLSTSSIKDECTCTCPPSRLCTCPTSQAPSFSQTVAGSAKPAVDTSTKLSSESPSLPQAQEESKEDWKSFGRIPVDDTTDSFADQDLKCEKKREIFRELLGNSCWIDEGDENAETEIFVSDEEDEIDDSKFRTNEDSNGVEEKHNQEDLDGLLSKYEKMALEKSLLEENQNWLIFERMHQEREITEAKECIKALKEQQLREREMMNGALADAKGSNKVLRGKLESVEENQERLGRENAILEAEVRRLTEALESLSKKKDPVRMVCGGTQSSTWRPWTQSFAPVWECPSCTFQNPAANMTCDMCG